jgi:hypothetical protein
MCQKDEGMILTKRRGARLGIFMAILCLAAMPAHSQESPEIADIRCVIVGMRLSATSDSQMQSRGIFMTLYYMGRLRGRTPNIEIEAPLVKEAKKMGAGEFPPEEKRCVTDLAQAGELLTQIGKDLIENQFKVASPASAPQGK